METYLQIVAQDGARQTETVTNGSVFVVMPYDIGLLAFRQRKLWS